MFARVKKRCRVPSLSNGEHQSVFSSFHKHKIRLRVPHRFDDTMIDDRHRQPMCKNKKNLSRSRISDRYLQVSSIHFNNNGGQRIIYNIIIDLIWIF